MNTNIPKIIHQLWVGDSPIPEHCKQFVEEMKKLHPFWEHHLWGNEIFEKYKDDEYLQIKSAFNITNSLLLRGYSKDEVNKIWSENFLRVWKNVSNNVIN